MSQEQLTEERVKELVQQYISARIEDVDEIRKSPAGRVLIIETEVKNINEKIDRLDAKVDSVKSELKAEIQMVKKEVQSSKNFSLALFIAIIGLTGSIFIKVFFFM